MTKSLDGEKLISTNDGFETVEESDLGIHDYDIKTAEEFPEKYNKGYDGLYPQGWRLFAAGDRYEGQPVLLTEFGGMAMKAEQTNGAWGYQGGEESEEDFYRHLEELLKGIAETEYQGFCYTQLTDVQQEVNGLLRADRTPKFQSDKLKSIFEIVGIK